MQPLFNPQKNLPVMHPIKILQPAKLILECSLSPAQIVQVKTAMGVVWGPVEVAELLAQVQTVQTESIECQHHLEIRTLAARMAMLVLV